MKPSHEKTPKGHLSHKSIEMLEVDMFLKGFLITFWRPSKNHKAQPRKNTKRAPEPQKHRNTRSWHVFERFSGYFLKASRKPWSPATKKHQKGTWATKASKCSKLIYFRNVFCSLFEGLQKTMKPSHGKTQKGHLSLSSSLLLFFSPSLLLFFSSCSRGPAPPRRTTTRHQRKLR